MQVRIARRKDQHRDTWEPWYSWTRIESLDSLLVRFMKLTGNTSGIPPLTGLDPSSIAFELRNRFSFPLLDFHDTTVAPWRRTSRRSPVGRVAITLELSSEMVTRGAGTDGEMGIAEGLLERSTILFALEEYLF